MTVTRRIALTALATLAAGPAFAAKAPAAALTAEDQALVDKAIATLTAMTSVKGRFTQTDARGGVNQGTLYLKRPGRARFTYDPPSGLTVVSDGHKVSVADTRLKTFDSYALNQTPLALFLAQDIRLDRGVKVTRVTRQADGGFSITAQDGARKSRGSITLEFGGAPLTLRGWSLVDAQGATTKVGITNLNAAPDLDSALFVIRDPRPKPGSHP